MKKEEEEEVEVKFFVLFCCYCFTLLITFFFQGDINTCSFLFLIPRAATETCARVLSFLKEYKII